MIELKHVFKSYRVKGAPEVKALDDVSVAFGEKGLVFILGKSGAGKSTMLNVIGGLDRIDSGDIVIMGKSSKDFSQSEFDSYRNTFLGFIFQEYNILNEFTVGQNIALAMQLQGKKGTPQEVNEILDMVDLHGLAERKPNQLSGGQKQRVAIARALIKKPQIIMADEPTGALDSKTGMQIFDTLKSLSKDHLVIVVSHDRDFAEFYGDRVIEMKDGKIISDISKSEVGAKEENKGLTLIGDKVISIKPGYTLTDKDLSLINSYVAKADKETIISIDNKGNNGLKAAAKINDDNSQGIFAETTPEKIGAKAYNPDDFHMTKSRLPFSRSFKMGLSSLKNKPVRLVVTAILSIVSLTMFGIADTLVGYNSRETFTQSYIANGQTSISLAKNIGYDEGGDARTSGPEQAFTAEEIATLNSESGMDFSGRSSASYLTNVYSNESGANGFFAVEDNFADKASTCSIVYSSNVGSATSFSEFRKGDILKLLSGVDPVSADEALITDWDYAVYQNHGYYDIELQNEDTDLGNVNVVSASAIASPESFLALNPKVYFCKNYSELSNGKYVRKYALTSVKIVGIIDTGWANSTYLSKLKDITSQMQLNGANYGIYNGFRNAYSEGDGNLLRGGSGFIDSLRSFLGLPSTRSILSEINYHLGGDSARIGKYYDFLMSNSKEGKYNNKIYRYDPMDSTFSVIISIDSSVSENRQTFFWVGFAFGCFSVLLMSTFIASSIAYKKREIGILRAVGARGIDIYGIFFNEAVTISLLDAVLASIVAGICSNSLNNALYSTLGQLIGTHFSLFAFSFRQILVVFAAAILTAALASFVPCLWISKKKPIDSINLR